MSIRTFALFIPCLILLTAFTSSQALARVQEQTEEFDILRYATDTKVNVEFEGGSVDLFVAILKEKAPGLNILIRSDVQNVALPELTLRAISAETALNSLTPLSLDALSVELNESQEYYIIGPNLDRAPEQVDVLNVAEYLLVDTEDGTKSVSTERQRELMSAIEAGQQMLASSSGTMKISLHETTGLLFVKGSPAETRLVKQIVQELVGNPSAGASLGGSMP